MNTKQHTVENIHFKNEELVLKIDGTLYSFPLKNISKSLLQATQENRQHFKVSPSGYGIHWEILDEDLSIDGLLGIRHRPVQERQLTSVHDPQADYTIHK